MRHRLALAPRRGVASEPAVAAAFFQPRVSRRRPRALLEYEHRGHPVPGQGDAAGGGGENSFGPAHRRSRFRCEPALLAEAGKVSHSRSADRVDGQNRLKGDAVPAAELAGDVFVGGAALVDLQALLPLAAPVAPAGDMALPEASRARAVPRPPVSWA